MGITLDDLRHHAISSSLFPPTALRRAMDRLGFVQADPIRAPARAQDLILRHRVNDYRAGDLERRYPRLNLEEDFLYAYGFMPLATWQLLHPRVPRPLTATEKRVLEKVATGSRLHPRELEIHFGKGRETNAWGGYSKSTTRTLERLHYLGAIRILGRQNGIKIYGLNDTKTVQIDPVERLRRLVLTIARILAPIPLRSLRAAIRHLGHAAPHLEGRVRAAFDLLETGELQSAEVDGVKYVWPAGRLTRKEPDSVVRFLAPFDPVVWDRYRFELFWGWPYRFEAYTPPAKRKLGYYAMPMLWKADVIGWVNAAVRDGELIVERGFSKPGHATQAHFESAFQTEVERLRHFLTISPAPAPESACIKLDPEEHRHADFPPPVS